MTPDLDRRTAIAEVHGALEQLTHLVAVRLEERRGAAAAQPGGVGQADALLQRPLGLAGGEGLPALDLAGGPIAQIVDAYALDAAETLAFVAALAPEVDEKFDVLYGHLCDRPATQGLTGEALRTLLGRSFAGRLAAGALLSPSGRLRRARLLRFEPSPWSALGGLVRVHPDVASWVLRGVPDEPEFSADFPAVRVETVHRFDDVVLAPETRERLRAVIERIRHRPTVLGTWGFAAHHDHAAGYHVLFHGPPGTGKTLSAAVVGREAGLPVYRIDLSTVVSKYIGETEKNLARIFDRAEMQDWILFFDEADALFGKRTEVHDARDRFANQEVSYLLQRLELFGGVTILATNLLANVDEAFLRRLHTQVAFAEPAVPERAALWRAVTPPDLPVDDGVDFDDLAQRFTLSGAEIRNAVFHAAYRAAADGQCVRIEHLLDGVRLEYEKSGRMFSPAGGRG